MKKSVCVVTYYKHNYGAFLQAYGLQNFLNSNGFEAKVLNYDYAHDKTILGVPLLRVKKPLSFVKSIIYKCLIYKNARKKDILFEVCACQKIGETKYYKHYKSLKKDIPEFDIYVTGSDQVWNPFMAEQGILSRFLEFAEGKKTAVLCSYAASLGISYLNGEVKNLFREHLKRFDKISVREQRSIVTLEEVTSKPIVVHKDPALLLNTQQWDEFAEPYKTDKPYLFIYLAQKAPDLIEFAKDLAQKQGWDIINCHGSVHYSIENTINGTQILTPMQFVGSIKNAEYVVTNSFHCFVFSIHYKKKVYLKLPPKGSSRLEELLEGMELYRLCDSTIIDDGEEEEIYSLVDEYLNAERIKAKEYFCELAVLSEEKCNEYRD